MSNDKSFYVSVGDSGIWKPISLPVPNSSDWWFCDSSKPKMNIYRPTKVVFSGKNTVVWFPDGDKIVVKCGEHDDFNPEVGVAMAIVRKVYGDNRSEFVKFVDNATVQPSKEQNDARKMLRKAKRLQISEDEFPF